MIRAALALAALSAPAAAQVVPARAAVQYDAIAAFHASAPGWHEGAYLETVAVCDGATGRTLLQCAAAVSTYEAGCRDVAFSVEIARLPYAEYALLVESIEAEAQETGEGTHAVDLLESVRADWQEHPDEDEADQIDAWQRACRAFIGLPL